MMLLYCYPIHPNLYLGVYLAQPYDRKTYGLEGAACLNHLGDVT